MSNENERPDVYLAKMMCERKGKKENIPLGIGFWNRTEWKMFFKQQILAANSLLKVYPFEVINAAITHKKMLWAYSLRSPQLKEYLTTEFAKYERKMVIEEKRKEKEITKPVIIQTEEAPVIIDDKQSLRNRLD